jgi:hypothetical protein
MLHGWSRGDRILCNFRGCLVQPTKVNQLSSAHFVAHGNKINFCRLIFFLMKVKTSSIGSRWLMEVNQLSLAVVQANVS